MSQFGMKMPGGKRSRGGGPDVYTGLLCLSVIALGAATALMYLASASVGPDGNAFAEQDAGRIALANK